MRQAILTVCAGVVAAAGAGCVVIQVPPTFQHESGPIEQTMAFDDAEGFATDLQRADVTIEGWDQPDVAMTARVWSRAYNDAAARELAEKTRVELKRTGDRVVVECVPARLLLASEQVGVDLTVRLPADASGCVNTCHGSVSATGLAGAIELKTSHGEITLCGSQAPVRCETTHGRILIEDPSAEVDCRATHGSITVRRPAGSAHCVTTHGSITVTAAKGALECSTSHGSIEASVAPGYWKGQPIKLETKHGSVKLDLPTRSDG